MFGLRMPRFLRRFIRRHMTAIDEKTAAKYKAGLSVVYMLIAWNVAGVAMYAMYNAKRDKELGVTDPLASRTLHYALLNKPNVQRIVHKGGLQFEVEPFVVDGEIVSNDSRVEGLKGNGDNSVNVEQPTNEHIYN